MIFHRNLEGLWNGSKKRTILMVLKGSWKKINWVLVNGHGHSLEEYFKQSFEMLLHYGKKGHW